MKYEREKEEESVFENVKTFLFGKQLTPDELVKKWKRELNAQRRELDRGIRNITREETKIKREIRLAAKRGDMSNARILAKEIVRSNKAKERMSISKAQINSVTMHLQQNLATFKMAGCIKKSTEIMSLMNSMFRLPEMQKTMMTMAKEMEKAGLIDEIVEETMDITDEIEEDEVNEEVNKVITELNLDLKGQTPEAGDRIPEAMKKRESEDIDEKADADLMARYQKMKET